MRPANLGNLNGPNSEKLVFFRIWAIKVEHDECGTNQIFHLISVTNSVHTVSLMVDVDSLLSCRLVPSVWQPSVTAKDDNSLL